MRSPKTVSDPKYDNVGLYGALTHVGHGQKNVAVVSRDLVDGIYWLIWPRGWAIMGVNLQ